MIPPPLALSCTQAHQCDRSFCNVSRDKCAIPHKNRQTGVYPYPLGVGSATPSPKKGAPETKNPSCIAFTVLRGGLGPWSQTMVSERARPWGRGRSEFAELSLQVIARYEQYLCWASKTLTVLLAHDLCWC